MVTEPDNKPSNEPIPLDRALAAMERVFAAGDVTLLAVKIALAECAVAPGGAASVELRSAKENPLWPTVVGIYADNKRQTSEIIRLREALAAVKADIFHKRNAQSIVCTVWHGGAETTVDFIDAALVDAFPDPSHIGNGGQGGAPKVDNEHALFIGEEAFKAGYKACVDDTGPAGVFPNANEVAAYADAAWSAYEPSEEAKGHTA